MENEDKVRKGVRLRYINILMIVMAAAVSVLLLVTVSDTSATYSELQADMEHYLSAQTAVEQLEEASNDLTYNAQRYTVTGDWAYVEAYLEEVHSIQRRDRAVEDLRAATGDESALTALEQALEASNSLTEVEYHAIALTLSAQAEQPERIPEEIAGVALTPEELALSPEERGSLAREMVFGDTYYEAKENIWSGVRTSAAQLSDAMSSQQGSSASRMAGALRRQEWLTIMLMAMVVVSVLTTSLLVIQPLRRTVEEMRRGEPARGRGVYEIRYLVQGYNELQERVRSDKDQLTYEATHDPLTGVCNRKLYESTMASSEGRDMGLIIVDIDDFKKFNDKYGHAVGDLVLKRVARSLQRAFRSEDLVCRIGGDEFVVLMLGATENLAELVLRKMSAVAEELRAEENGCPAITLSVGIAFNDRPSPSGTLFEDADRALYRVKEQGRNGRNVYGERDAHLPMTEITQS